MINQIRKTMDGVNMKNVLWITGIFPPINCGIGRPYKLAKYLPDNGWNPVVLAFKKSLFRPQMDESLLEEVKHLEVHRTKSGDSKLLQLVLPKLLGIDRRKVNSPDPWYRWQKHALKKGREIMESRGRWNNTKIDAIFSSSLPNTCHLIALKLKQEYELPWIADFRDLWTQVGGGYGNIPDSTLTKERVMESNVLMDADWVTMINQAGLDILSENRSKVEAKSSVITHGFDPEDYQRLQRQDYDNICTMTYAGSLYGARTNGAVSFLKALASIQDRSGVKVRFIGNCSVLRDTVSSLRLDNTATFIPWMGKRAALEMLAMSNVSLFLLGDSQTDRMASTGKLYDYLGVGRPIMAVAMPEGTAGKIILDTHSGTVNSPNDLQGIGDSIRYWATAYKDGHKPDQERMREHDVRLKAKEMAEVLSHITNNGGENGRER
ncbi:MAG: hypothetical protein JRD89_16200 [Deltaproteobacteria bacterium]|nr:hypothetical protein [Deltaproteobacteria bacterium]